MADSRLYMETIAGNSPTSATFNSRGAGKSQSTWLIGNDGQSGHAAVTTLNEVYKALVELLGTTYTHTDGVRLQRLLPKADPFIQWYYCEDVRMTGRGKPTTSPSTPLGQLEAPSFDKVTIYPCYAFECSFSPRPYAHIQDDTLPSGSVTYYGDRGATVGTYTYAHEWLRYTDIEMIPAGEYLTAQAGRFALDVASGQSPDKVAAIQGQARLFVKKNGVKITWYQVPYSYVDPAITPTKAGALGSWIQAALGHVNQYNWWNFPKGTLLLEAVAVQRYNPIVPKPIYWAGSTQIFSTEKLCDITFIMSYFGPSLGKDKLGNTATPRPPKHSNVVQQGHNYLAYAHMMSWYFAKTADQQITDNDNEPLYPSFPYELIFTNPGVTG